MSGSFLRKAGNNITSSRPSRVMMILGRVGMMMYDDPFNERNERGLKC